MEKTNIHYKTRGMSNPQGKSRVYFTCHPEDFGKFFDTISDEILELHDCAIYYYEPYNKTNVHDTIQEISQMQLFVIPITSNFLTEHSQAFDVEFEYAKKHHIPILPLLQEVNLEKQFNEKCGNIQCLNKYTYDPTSITYNEKIKKFLDSILVGEDFANEIRNEFSGCIFISYRKKDRKYLQKLMKQIHKYDFCRDIAFWYDEFLIPGEDFNLSITEEIEKCEVFMLVVTPNLILEKNYVCEVEYPFAVERKKYILPIEMKKTSKELAEQFVGIPECIKLSDNQDFVGNLKRISEMLSSKEVYLPKHNFLIGMAYLYGINMEVDHGKARKLIGYAAKDDLPEAMEKLSQMYYIGDGVCRNIEKAIYWQKKLVNRHINNYKKELSANSWEIYCDSVPILIAYYIELKEYMIAIKTIVNILKEWPENKFNNEFLKHKKCFYRMLAFLYSKINDYANAEMMYLKSIKLQEKIQNDSIEKELEMSELNTQLGVLYTDSERFDAALKCHENSLEIAKRIHTTNPDETEFLLAQIYNNIAGVYRRKGKNRKAIQLFKIAIKFLKSAMSKKPGELDSYLAEIAKNLGDVYTELKMYDESESYLNEAISIYEELIKKNPEVHESSYGWVLYSLGKLYMKTGKSKEAYVCLLKSLKIQEKQKVYYQLNNIEYMINTYKNIIELTPSGYEKTVLIKKYIEILKAHKEQGNDCSFTIASCYLEISEIIIDAEEYSCALEFLELAHDICQQFEKTTEAWKRLTSLVYYNYALAYSGSNDSTQAEYNYLNAIKLQLDICSLKNDSKQLENLAVFYENLADEYLKKDKYDKAIVVFKSAISTRKRIVDISEECKMILAIDCYLLSAVYYKVEKVVEALMFAKRAVDIFDGLKEKNMLQCSEFRDYCLEIINTISEGN